MTPSPLRVMIVDDHPLLRAAVTRAITSDDVTVVAEAASAEEALELAPIVEPDVLLVDITLSGMSGVQLVRDIAPRLPHTKIIMLTVSATDRDLIDAFRAGASGYLTKDLTPEALARAVRAARTGELIMPRRLAARLVERLSRRMPVPAGPDEHDYPPVEALSDREREILRLLVDGHTDREIATALTISVRTVETHVSNILHKLGVRNRAEAARRYRAEG